MSAPITHVLAQLAVVVGGAAIVAIAFQLARLPVVLGYLLAGLLLGPHVVPALAPDPALVDTLADLGVILLFFTIGLEFSVRTIARVGGATLLTVLIELAIVIAVVYGVGRALGWTGIEALFAAVGVAIASTMLVVKGLEEQGRTGPAVELVLAMMVVEDLLSILLLAVLTGVASGAGMSAGELGRLIAELGGFLLALLVIGLLVIPRLVRAVVRLGRAELLLVTSLAICVGMAWAAARAGYSIALGAFTAGTLIAESGKGKDVDLLVRPFRDAFAAIFFVAIGMMIDPSLVADHWLPVVVLAATLVAVKSVAVTLAAFLTGQGLGRAVEAGLALSQIGEYAFIAAAVGIGAGVARPMLLPVVVGAACITAITGSWQVRGSERAATWVGGHLPRAASTFVSFYEAWIARLRGRPRAAPGARRIRRRAVWLVVDAAILVAIVIGAATVQEPIASAAAVAVGGLFGFGAIRHAIGLARLLAAEIIPDGAGGVDLGNSPRRALVVTLELAIALAVGLPVAIVVQPFVPGGGLVVVALVIVLALVAHRSVVDFDRHVRAGSELIVEVLAHQGRDPARPAPGLAEIDAVLPGFEGLAAIALPAAAPAVGRSLAELDLRARTGASVLAITRGGGGVASPAPHDPLRAGDVLAVAGSADAIAAARALLVG